MKTGELIDFLMLYDKDDEVQIEIYETLSDNYIDTTAAITIVEENVNVPILPAVADHPSSSEKKAR